MDTKLLLCMLKVMILIVCKFNIQSHFSADERSGPLGTLDPSVIPKTVPTFSIDYQGNVTATPDDQKKTVQTNEPLLPPGQSSANLVVSITCEKLQTDYTVLFVSFI